jgi:quinol-cytochrome oxidoreductase complex cytochrome b subunit
MNLKRILPLSVYGLFVNGLKYPVPPSINYFWNFGSLSLLALFVS